jgi:hypothetical protein
MNVVALPRGGGKTTELVRLSVERQIPIVTVGDTQSILDRAQEIGVNNLPTPVRYHSNRDLSRRGYQEFIIDNADNLFEQILGVRINTISISTNEPVHMASAQPQPVHIEPDDIARAIGFDI